MSPCEFCEIFKNTYFYRTPPVAASVDKKSLIDIQTLTDNLIQKDEIFNTKIPQGFDSLFMRSNNKLTSVVNADKNLSMLKQRRKTKR